MTSSVDTQSSESHVIFRIVTLFFLAIILGVIASLGAIAFVECVQWINDALLISPRSRVLYEQTPWIMSLATVLVPVGGGLVVGVLVHRLSPEKRPLGPADAILSVQIRKPLPTVQGGIVSTLAAIISIGCGASVGQYGPMVYLGALAGGLASRLKIPVRNLRAIAIACGVAAAISTAFNAPIAGLVFAHEVILRHYSIQAFAPTTVASVVGYVIANVIFERPPLFLVSFDGVGQSHEFLLFAVIGIMAALLAIVFMRSILTVSAMAMNSRIPPMWRPGIAGLVLGAVALVLPEVMGIGTEALRFATIEGAFQSWELGIIVVAKIALTALCLGFGFSGGVFSPALLIGVLFGAFFWSMIDGPLAIQNSGIVVYAICGMMALASPVIGAPLTAILIVFELTRSYDLTIAAMVSVVFANLICYRVFGRSIFDVQLARKGIDLSHGRDQVFLSSILVAPLAGQKFIRCSAHEHLDIIFKRLQSSGRAEAVTLDEQGKFLGIIRVQDAWDQPKLTAADVVRQTDVVFDETTTLWQAMKEIERFVGDAIPVVSSQDGQLIGMLTEGDLFGSFLSVTRTLRQEENETI